MLKLKNPLLLLIFLVPAAILAGGTVTIENKSSQPVEVFNKTPDIESESGGPIIPSGGTYKIVGRNASEYLFSIGTLDHSSFFTLKVAYLPLIVRRGNYYSLQHQSEFSPCEEAPKLTCIVTKMIEDEKGAPHDYEAFIAESGGIRCHNKK